MTGEPILSQLFENKEIRVIQYGGDVWIPIADLAAAWGIDRSTPDKMIERNQDVFEGVSSTVLDTVSTPMKCLNERGLYLMMGKISAARLKNPGAKLVIIRFQKWFPQLIQKFRRNEIMQLATAPDIKTELQQAKEYAGICERDAGSFQAAVFKKYGMPEFADVLRPALIHGETGWYNPTRLVTLCNDPDLTPERLNWYLKNKGFQYRDGYIWRLTPAGLIHGREYNFESPGGHIEVRIAWRSSILYASGLKRPVPEDQTALVAGVKS